ncbi:MAG: lipopolysaccharide biosynthesis protein [Duncaniella sp.]|nr:lipopolysaccharide biosynthesis protein [Duncaniella sp.]
MQISDNKRIAKNTLLLYVRMLLIMGVNLYTSRVVLDELGVDDYGVYTVVGGVVLMLSFLNSCMSTATQRFINYELGNPEGTEQSLKNVFSTSISIHLAIAVVVLMLAETVGLWFVNHKLVIPAESVAGANIVYQTSIAVFCINIMQVPFNSAIIAHEKMEIFALLSILESLLKLSIAFALVVITSNKLACYGFLVLGVHAIVAASYICISLRKFKECSLRCVYIPGLFREMLVFAGWNLFGSIAWLVRGQGLGILLNIFFGPVLNAAKGVADQVSNAVSSLIGNFQLALNPQITKNYAAGEIDSMELLTYRGIKFSCCLLWLVMLPLVINMDRILGVWLVTVPDFTAVFLVLILIDSLCSNLFGGPMMASLAATGRIRNYQIIVSLALLVVLPAAYIALKMGMSPLSVFYLNIVFNLIGGGLRFWFCKHQLGYSLRFYLRYVMLPFCGVIAVSLPLTILCEPYIVGYFTHRIAVLAVSLTFSFLIALASVWFFGFSSAERLTISTQIVKKLSRGKDL